MEGAGALPEARQGARLEIVRDSRGSRHVTIRLQSVLLRGRWIRSDIRATTYRFGARSHSQ